MKRPKKIIVSVISDLVTDQRVHRCCDTLHKMGFDVLLIGRQKQDSLPMPERNYKFQRMKLLWEKGPLFYAEINIRLFLKLLFFKADLYLANDLDTLLPNYLVSRIKGKPLIYDSHEYFCGVPEIQARPLVKKAWQFIEKLTLPKVNKMYTVNASIAGLYEEEYSIKPTIVRNIPPLRKTAAAEAFPIDIPRDKPILLVQGAGINVDRGIEEAVEAMKFVNEATMLILGGGDVLTNLKQKVDEFGITHKVHFMGKVPFEKLHSYTQLCTIGLSLDKDTNINYRFSLPNKLFDYIHAGLAVLSSPLPELKRIIDEQEVGTFIENHDPQHIAERINYMLADEQRLQQWKSNALKAAETLNWQEEKKKLQSIFEPYLH